MRPHILDLAQTLPPSRVMLAPFRWLDALEERYTTAAAISSGLPNRLFGLASAIAFVPPVISIKPLAILEGKKPGAMLLTRMPRGPSSTARLRVRCRAAALEALYPNVACSPREPTPRPAIEAVTITRDGSSSEPFFCSRGANLDRKASN